MWFKSSFTTPAVAAISFCLIGGTSPAAADILHVPGDFPTIQAAIDAAVDGDEVEVHPGTYNENINLLGKAITVRSSDGAGVTTIDAGDTGIVVTCTSGEGPDTILDGFTITGGSASSGAGMYNFDSSPTVTNCTFSGNSGTGMYNDLSSPTVTNCTFSGNSGTGMFNEFSGPTVTNCTFSGNTVDGPVHYGGGMLNDHSSPTVTNSTFSGNSAVGSESGGGGMANFCSSPTVTNCTFSGNSAVGSESGGGGMYNNGLSSPTVINCTFSGNSAGFAGGGMRNDVSSPTVTNCTFSGNSVNGDQSFGQGGGVYNGSNSNSTFTNCVFAGNNAGGDGADGGAMYNSESDPLLINCLFTNNEACEGAGGMTNNHSNPVLINCTFSHTLNSLEGALLNLFDSNPTVIGCILWDTGMPPITGRATVTYSCIQGGWRGIGNIEVNPMFVDPDGPDNDIFTWEDNDYRLSPGSPCIDAADNTAVPQNIDTDLDGNPRFVDDPATKDTGNGDPPIVDMGAYEFQPALCPGDLDNSGDVGVKDLLILLGAWGPCPPKGDCPADFDDSGDVGVKDLLVLLGNWGSCP